MCEVNNFKIDLDGIRDTFKFSETGLTNKQGVKYVHSENFRDD